MKTLTPTAVRFSILLPILIGFIACSKTTPPVDPAYASEVNAWREARLERLTADDGWLTLTGLFWLEPGENRFGSAEDNEVVLPDPNIPEVAGMLRVDPEGAVTAISTEESSVQINGEPLTESAITTDAQGKPDIISAGRISYYIIDRGERLGARVKDPGAASRLNFQGIEHFPINPNLRITARLEPYDTPREVAIPTVLGQDTTMLATGVLRFTVNGKEHTLEPYGSGEEDEKYFLIFRDATAGQTTYGAGRFLSADSVGDDGSTVLDFNLAYNPPCAFTPFATCPLPPPQNVLAIPIEAGEMYSGDAH